MVGEASTITWLIIICLAVIFFFVLSKPLKLLAKIAINSGLGLVALLCINFILSPVQISVGINLLTVLIVGILGLPGFICLYLMQIIL